MSKRNSRAAKAARRAARLQRQARPMISVPGIPDMMLPAVLEVQLDRMEDEDEEGPYVTWVASGGSRTMASG